MKFLFTLAFLLIVFSSLAQEREVVRQRSYWIRYQLVYRHSENFVFRAESEQRRFLDPDVMHQQSFRVFTESIIKEGWSLGAGAAYFIQATPVATENYFTAGEYRVFEDLNYRQLAGDRFSISHRYRFEQRMFQNINNERVIPGHHFLYRFRYQVSADYKLVVKETVKGGLSLRFGNEIMIQAGKQAAQNPFDQNRIFASLLFGLTDNFVVDVGYLKWYQQRRTANQYFNRDILRVAMIHNLK